MEGARFRGELGNRLRTPRGGGKGERKKERVFKEEEDGGRASLNVGKTFLKKGKAIRGKIV